MKWRVGEGEFTLGPPRHHLEVGRVQIGVLTVIRAGAIGERITRYETGDSAEEIGPYGDYHH